MPEARRTVATVVDQIMASLSLLALSWDDRTIEGFTVTALEGTKDDGTKEKNAIDLRFGTGERFVVFVAPGPGAAPDGAPGEKEEDGADVA